MNIIIRLLQIVTLIPYLLFAGYSLFVRKEVLLGLLFLGLEAFTYFLLLKKKYQQRTPEEKTMTNAGRIAYSWMFIFLFSFMLFENAPYRYGLLVLGLVPPGLLLVWAACTGRWKKMLKARF